MHISTLKLKAGENEQEVLRNTYQYKEGELAGSTTNYVKQHVINDRTYDYTYDVRGNITQISLNGNVVATYTYDEFDQLISETKNGVTTTWTYDAGGNILTKSSSETIIEYTYGDAEWKDKLTNYNGKSITYDDIGNPLTIGTDTTLTWEAGRRLASITKVGVTTSFIYNADGYRTSKTSGGVTTTYHLDGSRITAMIKGTDELSFAYDENGAVIGLYHNGTAYAYAKNLQGDIIDIIDGSGSWVVTYEYDAWGNPIATSGTLAETLGQLNPFRYRGYIYDVETGFYLTGTRYYDPEIGRFINADSLIDNRGIITQNLFQYCGNNPVNNADPSGNLFGAIVGIGLLVIGIVATLSGCSSKPAASPSKPSTPSKPSNPSSSSSSTTSPHIPTPQEKSYAATVYAEAGGQNKRSKQAVAHVMNNRIGTRSSWTDIESVISAKYQFDGYNSPMYQAAMNYYNNGICNNSIEQAAMDECLAVVIPIYSGAESDITGGALYFHSFANPSDWAYHNSYTQVYVPGTEKFWFYK